MDDTANMICLDESEDEVLIGGRADHTLPFIPQIDKDKWVDQSQSKEEGDWSISKSIKLTCKPSQSLSIMFLTLYSQFMTNM